MICWILRALRGTVPRWALVNSEWCPRVMSSIEDIAAMLGMDVTDDIVREAWQAQCEETKRQRKAERAARVLGDHLMSGEKDLAPSAAGGSTKRHRRPTRLEDPASLPPERKKAKVERREADAGGEAPPRDTKL